MSEQEPPIEVLEIIRQSGAVPSMPQVVTRFLEMIQREDFDYDDLVTVLSTDPGTVADILRLSNSALFGVARKITSLKQAMTLVGPRRIRSLLLGRYMVESLSDQAASNLDAGYFWRRSLTTAALATRFAQSLCPTLREEAFIAGLLSDIGVTILAQAMPDAYATMLAEYRPNGAATDAAQEKCAVGTSHAEVSAMILEHWQLPEIVCEGVSRHQTVNSANTPGDQLACIIQAADGIAKLLCESPDIDSLEQKCRSIMSSVNCDLTVLSDSLDAVRGEISELGSMLRLDIVPSSSYSLIARSSSLPSVVRFAACLQSVAVAVAARLVVAWLDSSVH